MTKFPWAHLEQLHPNPQQRGLDSSPGGAEPNPIRVLAMPGVPHGTQTQGQSHPHPRGAGLVWQPAERDMPPAERDISWPAVALSTATAVKKTPPASPENSHRQRPGHPRNLWEDKGREREKGGRDKQFPTQLWLEPALQETHGP